MTLPPTFRPPVIVDEPVYQSGDWTFTNDGAQFTLTISSRPVQRANIVGVRVEIIAPDPDRSLTDETTAATGAWTYGVPALPATYIARIRAIYLFGRNTRLGPASEKTTTVDEGDEPAALPAYELRRDGEGGDVEIFIAPDPDQAGNPPTVQFRVLTGVDLSFARWTSNRTLGDDSLGNQLIKASTYNASTNAVWLTRNVNGQWQPWLDRSNQQGQPGALDWFRFRYALAAGSSIEEITRSNWSNEIELVYNDQEPGDPEPQAPQAPTVIASPTGTDGRVNVSISGPSNTGTSPLAAYRISEQNSAPVDVAVGTSPISVTFANGVTLTGSSFASLQANAPQARWGGTASFTVRALNTEGLISSPSTSNATWPGQQPAPDPDPDPDPGVTEGLWRLNDALSQAEYNRGPTGGLWFGSGEQLPHGYAACESNGNAILFYQDTGTPIVSSDGGITWRYPAADGYNATNAVDCGYDPVNPLVFFLASSSRGDGGQTNGVYVTFNRGVSFRRLFSVSRMGQWDSYCNSSFTWDPSSISGGMARTWYFPMQPNNSEFRGTIPELSSITQRLYRVTNLGQSNEQVTNLHALPNSTVGKWVTQSRVNPANTQRLYLCCENGLFEMNLSNGNLTEITNGLPGSSVSSIECNSAGTDWTVCVAENGLWRASSPTGPWTRFRAANASQHSVCRANRNRIMYRIHRSGTPGGEVWSSTNNGGAWTQARKESGDPSGLSNFNRGRGHGYIWNPTIQNRINGFGNTGYMTISTDSGVSLRASNFGFTGNSWGRGGGEFGFDVGNPQRYMFGFNDVNVKSTTNGGLWFVNSIRAPGRDGSNSNGLVASIRPVAGSNVWLATISGSYNNGQVYRTTTAGQPPAPQEPAWELVISSTSGRNLYHGWNLQNTTTVWTGERRSTNQGATWTAIPSLSGRMVCAISRSNGAILYALQDSSGRRNVFICENGNAGSPTFSAAFDAGTDITQPGRPTVCLRVNPQDPLEVWTIDPGNGLARWRRSGSNWSRTTMTALQQVTSVSAANRVQDIAIDPRFPDVIYVAMSGRGRPMLFRSTNGGGRFVDISDGWPKTEYNGMAINPLTGDLHVGSSAGSRIYPPPYTQTSPRTNWSRLDGFGNNVLF